MTYEDTDAEGKFVIGLADELAKLRADNERLTGALENIRDYAGGTGQSHIAALAHVALMASLVAQSEGGDRE